MSGIKSISTVSAANLIQALTYLCEQHERVVRSEVLLKELHTVSLQGRYCVLLCCVQSGHDCLRTDLDLIGIKKPAEMHPLKFPKAAS